MDTHANPVRVKVLVTGATGFVGGAVVERILAEGDVVHVLVRDPDDARAQALRTAGAVLFTGTLADPNEVARAARDCRVVVHAAGHASHHASRRALMWTHVAGTENVLKAARHVGCRRVVHVSCADVSLVNADRMHWNEDKSPETALVDDFARSKLLAEELAVSSSDEQLEVAAVRPAWLWGPGDTSVLPDLCREGLAGGLRLFGDGKNLVATSYIDHVVEAIVSACEARDAHGRAYNVADPEFLDAGEFFTMLSRAVGLPPPRPGLPFAAEYALAWLRQKRGAEGLWPGDVARRGRSTSFDVGRATKDLEYEPTVKMADGMERLAAWVREQGGAAAIAKLARPPATDASVAAQVAAAGPGDA